MERWNFHTLYISTTNSISIVGFNFEIYVHVEGLLKNINSPILYKEYQSKSNSGAIYEITFYRIYHNFVYVWLKQEH